MNPPLDNPMHVEGCDAAGVKPDAEPVDREYVTVNAVFCLPVARLKIEPDQVIDDDTLKNCAELLLHLYMQAAMGDVAARYRDDEDLWRWLAESYQECQAVEAT